MSGHLLRRNTSKAGLQNLLRMTTQRSMEDAEEIERERRRRARERSQGSHNDQTGPASPTRLTQDNGPQETDALCESELKANGCQLALEEDEGFSDWTQRLEKRRQRHLEEQEGRGDRPPPALDQQPGLNGVAPTKPCLKTRSVPGPEETEEWEWSGSETQEAPQTVDGDKVRLRCRPNWIQSENRSSFKVAEKKRSELKISYTSNMKKHVRRNGETPGVEVTSYLVAGKMTPSLSPCLGQQVEEVDGGAHEGLMETQQKLGQGHGTLEQLRQRQQEDQEEMEEVNRRREERNRAREEEEQRRGEEESHKQKQVEEETRTVNEGIDRRRASAERRLKNLSISSNEGDESLGHFSPMSPTFKLNERTESLNRSLQKSNSIKKTEPPLPISKIDNRLEQYTHAIEEAKVAKQQALTDLPSPSEPVASKKSLFEAGEAWSQTPKGTPSKDTEGLKVGVADLIHQWVKGNPDGSCKSPSSIPAEVKAGDVLSKKNLWENVGDSPSPGRVGKGAAGKKYKFVMMAHGKYEKVAVGDDA
ncbi:lymphocyte-specific protein 1 isoform X2 [Esox lucius]|uniref:lymphocyte-specific protein 1 isoform X2 n=1 Tax=Esox lucius TaxID=8010 RepID=UPI000576B7A1|nr:lymphocyte-specific protein 1 isoform X2 [Esox lucius]